MTVTDTLAPGDDKAVAIGKPATADWIVGDPRSDGVVDVQSFDCGAVTTVTFRVGGVRFDGCAKRHPDDDEFDNPRLGRALAMQRALQSAVEYYEDFVRQIRRGR